MNYEQIIGSYCGLMEEIKRRSMIVTGCLSRPIADAHPIYELCFLQFRMICELIALACLVAHGEIQEAKALEKHNDARKVLRALERLKPKFYPSPRAQSIDAGKVLNVPIPIPSDYLTKALLLKLYGRCGDVLHVGNLKDIVSRNGFPKIEPAQLNVVEWSNRIHALLNHHKIFLGNDRELWVDMHRKRNGRPIGHVIVVGS